MFFSRVDADPITSFEPKFVEETFSRLEVIFHLYVENQVIRTTGEHPFYAEGKGWVDAQELVIGDRVLGSKGEWLTIRDLLDTGEFETVYNMRIADHHTYFVGDDRWGWDVWSHNKCHTYAIFNKKTGDVYKIGVSRGGMYKSGKSIRAQNQLAKIARNNKVPREDLESVILREYPNSTTMFKWENRLVGFYRQLVYRLVENMRPNGIMFYNW
ncbi:hypothetical protein KIH39_21240 [Telmatocola sphagniphila]|uniref:Intein C-terminal splicing domain-containing protein n=1 Tax=Telmatocola sphagniphila TaxID=1123043 RepID=A0A8E6EXJ7_9BACT|nr:polymorphic toxin-type HINT domain-containing protein [Telmatocola sphagniphila]QVL31346.1 hypothetical protein KIH39_21240 [Telmatocola sphagniphila]